MLSPVLSRAYRKLELSPASFRQSHKKNRECQLALPHVMRAMPLPFEKTCMPIRRISYE